MLKELMVVFPKHSKTANRKGNVMVRNCNRPSKTCVGSQQKTNNDTVDVVKPLKTTENIL